MKIARFVALAALVFASVVTTQVSAADAAPAASASAPAAPTAPGEPGTTYSKHGADTCLECHDADADTPTFTTAGIFKGKHGQRRNSHSPFGQGGLQCEACHGPGDRHATQKTKRTLTIASMKANSFQTPAQRNEACLSCHQNSTRNAWHGGAHDRAQLACTDCHKLHTDHDPVLNKKTEAEVCYRCHKEQRTQFQKPSTHPVSAGLMACSDCHNAHGSSAPAQLAKPTLNQTCFSCHAEKRGPMLWEHAPVSEDCALCHTSHGSVRPALLSKSPTMLCQSCHSVAGHPAVARTGAALPGNSGGGSIFLVNGGCTNCHSQIHGSNHPAGAKLMR